MITPQIGAQIMDGMLANIVARVHGKHKVELTPPDTIRGPTAHQVHQRFVQRRTRRWEPAGALRGPLSTR